MRRFWMYRRQTGSTGQKFSQRLQAAGDEKIRFGVIPARQDVIGGKGDPVCKVYDHDAVEKFLTLWAVKLGQACGKEIHRAIEQFAFSIEYSEADGFQPRQASHDRL